MRWSRSIWLTLFIGLTASCETSPPSLAPAGGAGIDQTDGQSGTDRWTVTGRVTDTQGRPLAGATVTANCGNGTLIRKGEATTTSDGCYVLRFGPGLVTARDPRSDTEDQEAADWAPPQFAVVRASKPGWFETNLSRQGGLVMAVGPIHDDEVWASVERPVVLVDQPFSLDFTMEPSARIDGRLVDEHGCSIAKKRLWIAGPWHRPDWYVLGSVTTDENGRFTFQDIPVRRTWWLALGAHHRRDADTRSPSFVLPKAGVYQVTLRGLRGADERIAGLELRDGPSPSTQ